MGVVSVEGLEPATNGLKGHCSAIELHARSITRTAFYHASYSPSTAPASINLERVDPLTFPARLVTMTRFITGGLNG